MYTEMERRIVAKVTSAVPPIYREQRDQFARTLPLLAILGVVFAAVFGGWLGAIFLVLRVLVSAPASIGNLALSAFFWLALLPPLLWLASIYPLRDRRLIGWRLFVGGTILSLIGSLLSLNLINILFSGAILYFSLQCYDEFYR
jgi:hypothetical protein